MTTQLKRCLCLARIVIYGVVDTGGGVVPFMISGFLFWMLTARSSLTVYTPVIKSTRKNRALTGVARSVTAGITWGLMVPTPAVSILAVSRGLMAQQGSQQTILLRY